MPLDWSADNLDFEVCVYSVYYMYMYLCNELGFWIEPVLYKAIVPIQKFPIDFKIFKFIYLFIYFISLGNQNYNNAH